MLMSMLAYGRACLKSHTARYKAFLFEQGPQEIWYPGAAKSGFYVKPNVEMERHERLERGLR